MVSTNQSASSTDTWATRGEKIVNKPDPVLRGIIDGIRTPEWAHELLVGEAVYNDVTRMEVVDSIVDNPDRGQEMLGVENRRDDPREDVCRVIADAIERVRVDGGNE